MKKFIFFKIFFICINLFSQRFIELSVDNDLYFSNDEYYSSGVFVKYEKRINYDDEINKPKVISWVLAQKIYNPLKRFSQEVSDFDYPYGGWLYIENTIQNQIKKNLFFKKGIQFGLTGDGSLARWIQNNYHDTFLGISKMPWIDQVPQSFHLNILLNLDLINKIDMKTYLISNLNSFIGTQKISSGIKLGLNYGNFLVENNSFFNSLTKKKLMALYFGFDLDYFLHDYMNQGSIFNNNAPFTIKIKQFRYNLKLGFSLKIKNWKITSIFNQLSKDNVKQLKKYHKVLNISLTHFFN